MKTYAILSALIWLAVTLVSHGYFGTGGFFYDLPNRQMPFGRFFILYISAFIIYLAAVIKVSKIQAERRKILIVFTAAILFRLILLPGIPVHENDIYRYIWDGKVSAAGINPYKYPPIQASIKPGDARTDKTQIPINANNSSFSGLTGESSRFQKAESPSTNENTLELKPLSKELNSDFEKLKSIRDEDPKFYRRISFKDIPTVYPPFAQAMFAVSTLLAPGSILFMKFLFVLFDTAVIFLLYMILKNLKQNPLYVVVYAWNPLVLKEFANSGHYDVLAICCVTAAVYLISKEKYLFSSVSLGLGVLSKFFPVIFIPFFLLKKQYRAFIICLIIITAGYVPFFFWGDTGPLAVFTGFGTYTQEWSSNGFIFNVFYSLSSFFGNKSYLFSKVMCGVVFLFIWIIIYFKGMDLIEKMFWALTFMFLLSPVGYPWYFCWVISFLSIYRSFSLIALSGLLIMHYFIFTRDFGSLNLGKFEIDNLLLMQYVPFYILFIIEWCLKSGRYRKASI